MSEQDTTTPVAEVPATTETTVTPQTIDNVLKTPEVTPAPKPNAVPESVFLNEKKARKEAEKKLQDLQDSIRDGATVKETSADIAAIAKEFDLDPTFLDKFAKSIRAETEKELESKFDSKLKPMEEERLQKKMDATQKELDQAFDTQYQKEIVPIVEFQGIVNPAVIKALSLQRDPQGRFINGHKTLTQLVEEAYGAAIPGKRTLPDTTPGGGKDPAPLDYDRANRDKAYFAEVMANPTLKAAYNHKMLRS